MRESLRPLEGQRIEITATVAKFGCRHLAFDLFGETVMFKDVTSPDGEPLTPHVWMPLGLRLAALDLRKGDVLRLSARVSAYTKHKLVQQRDGRYIYTRANIDFKLTHPTRIQRIAQGVSQ